jgi:hypothetical protein
MVGCPWLPADEAAHTVFVYDVAKNSWKAPWRFLDAMSDFAVRPDGRGASASCWDRGLYLLDRDGGLTTQLRVGGPARVGRKPTVDPTDVTGPYVGPTANPWPSASARTCAGSHVST